MVVVARQARFPSGMRACLADGCSKSLHPLRKLGVVVVAHWRDGRLWSLSFRTGGIDDPHGPTFACDPDAELSRWLEVYQHRPGQPAPRLPLYRRGTPFQRRVWALLRSIPVGGLRRYGELADRLGSSPRAVAAACRANPWVLYVPCHRVVAKKDAGGFMGARHGWAVDLKRRLLEHEAGS